jgi:hypothetical protein
MPSAIHENPSKPDPGHVVAAARLFSLLEPGRPSRNGLFLACCPVQALSGQLRRCAFDLVLLQLPVQRSYQSSALAPQPVCLSRCAVVWLRSLAVPVPRAVASLATGARGAMAPSVSVRNSAVAFGIDTVPVVTKEFAMRCSSWMGVIR